ncbi:Do family serine endopeptidase [Helicobacter jaachi]|uniref:Do family serine endopeptidase n=1 Tax=Helicobacter jaachi TaxID=1677920 RepID=A0A4U8TAA5_9HELI|nr:Do family serine endopeptidase [Helicobacter jaachi]TLD96058.1 Do family serine endopeptidase [Helicobacter jaachi]
MQSNTLKTICVFHIFFLGFLLLNSAFAIDFKEAPKAQKRINPQEGNDSIYSYNSSIEDAKKAVVNISAQKTINNQLSHPMFSDPFFQQFFGDIYGQVPRERFERSLGSGVIISNDGYIITNYHVIEDASKVLVSLADNPKEYAAKIIGTDARSDLAVIKIEQTNLSPIAFAQSANVLVGDVAFAIGNPFGVGETVTQGIVSALNKTGIGINDYENFIQTDASINPGNSGGALVDSRGALIGINTAILSRTGGNHGVGFAIPSDMVKKIAKELIEKGSIKRGFLGVGIQDVSSDLKDSYNDNTGAVVISLEPQSPAAKAGLMVWDLITHINGKKVSSAAELKNLIGMLSPNEKVVVKFIRDKQERVTQITLTEQPNTQQGKQNPAAQDNQSNSSLNLQGLEVAELNNSTRQRYRIPNGVDGVVVTRVSPNSKAQEAGFEIGDVIAQVESMPIRKPADLSTAFTRFKDKNKRILVYSANGTKTILIK